MGLVTWMSIMLHVVPFLWLIMSQVCTTMAIATTTPVTVVSSGMSSLSSVTMAPSLTGLPVTFGQHDVLPPPLTLRCPGGVMGLTSLPQQQPPCLVPLQAYANYAMSSPQIGFFFIVEPPTVLYIINLVPVLVSALYFQVPYWMPYSPLGAQPLGLHPCNPLEFTHGRHMCNLVMITPAMHRVAAPSSTTLSGGLLLLNQLFPSHPIYMVGHTALGAWYSHPIPLPSLHGGVGSSFPGLVPSNDTVDSESAMAVKPGESGVVIVYWVDEFTHTWSAERFAAHSHIYPGFTDKMASLTHFPLEPGCEAYSFLDQAVADFQQGLDSILTDSLETPELDTSLDEPDAIPSSVSSGLSTWLVLCDNSKPQLVPGIRSHKLWCQARALLVPVFLATKMSASKLITIFLVTLGLYSTR